MSHFFFALSWENGTNEGGKSRMHRAKAAGLSSVQLSHICCVELYCGYKLLRWQNPETDGDRRLQTEKWLKITKHCESLTGICQSAPDNLERIH